LIDKAWSHVKTPDSSLGGKESANIVTNIMKDKNNFLMGLNKTEKKRRKERKLNSASRSLYTLAAVIIKFKNTIV